MVRKGAMHYHCGFAAVDLADFLDSLPAGLAKPARMAWVEGYTEQEIADKLGISQPTVCRRIAEARRRFAEVEGR